MNTRGTKAFFAANALLPGGWEENVEISIGNSGAIETIRVGATGQNLPRLEGPVVPGMINLHSHAFQRSMTGKVQRFADGKDDFWSWRESMYAIAECMDTDNLYTIARRLYTDMLRNGYTSVCEFHYLHGDSRPTGSAGPEDMASAIIHAAHDAGIGLTLLPVLYEYGGFSATPVSPRQQRFVLSITRYLRLIDSLRAQSTVRIGYAPHSLRAVGPAGFDALLVHRQSTDPECPVHIHISEQAREVTDCIDALGQRPIDWLLDHADIDSSWCLVHATHASKNELQRVIATGACIGLCPVTEADLGDGIFQGDYYFQAGGQYGIGSDSNVSVSPGEEIRLLEYVQRLSLEKRSVSGTSGSIGIGSVRYMDAVEGGSNVSGRQIGHIREGASADLVVLDAENPLFEGLTPDEMLNAHIFSGGAETIKMVLVSGKRIT